MTAVIFEEQLLCSICLEVFVEPVTTPCGHNFCKSCVSTHWQQGALCLCPLCKQDFSSCPQLQVNTLMSELVGQFRNRPEEGTVNSGRELLCDMCTESRQKALKSCLVCLLSYCQRHLLAHQSLPRLQSHPLTEPLERLEERLCPSHNRLLELYCRREQTCLCLLCSILEHKDHPVVSLKEEYEQQQGVLQSTWAQTQSLMEERQEKIREVQHWLQLSDSQALTAAERGQRLHKALMDTVQSSENSLTEQIQEQQRSAHRQAEGWTSLLQQEIEQLQRISTAMEELQHSDDHLTFLQNLPRMKTTTPLKDRTLISLQEPNCEALVDKAMSQLSSALNQVMKKEKNSKNLEKVKKWAVDVTLDPDTACSWLVLSEDLKQAYDGNVWRDLPDNPNRFSDNIYVLGKQGFSSGMFYFEVQVKGHEWDVGVATELVNRKGTVTLSPEHGVWTIALSAGGRYRACDQEAVSLHLTPPPDTVGVFVDYEQGLVSFYDADFGALIYSFTNCNFTEKLHPFIGPCANDNGENPAPLTILTCGQNG